MENLMLLVVFTYPGAICDMVYTHLAKEKSYFSAKPDAFRIARDFFFSALVALVTMPFVIPQGQDTLTLENWVKQMQRSDALWRFLALSLLASVLLGLAWYLIQDKILFPLQAWYAERTHRPVMDEYQDVWRGILAAPDTFALRDSVFLVRRQGKLVRAGIPHLITHDIHQDKALVLTHCDAVEAELNSDSGRIQEHVASYYDIEHDVEIEIRHATPLLEEIERLATGANVKTSSEAAEQA